MSTTYQAPLATYENHAPMHGYSQSLPQVGRVNKPTMADQANAQLYRSQAQLSHPPQQQQVPLYWQTRHAEAPTVPQIPQNRPRPTTPSSDATMMALPQNQSSRAPQSGSETLVYHSLDIPKCISPTGGNLADFAAQMTCLFWFSSVDELNQAALIRTKPPNTPVSRLPVLAKPHEQFRKWVLSVLSTTQVTQNVVLLGLLFIYRLKMASPQVKGRAGSEYRLLVVALMLANKFLDDNTYTNKTWAEVSSFAVKEIHVMEVEFLSNMRYNLLASKPEWDGWLEKLSCFHEHYERALRVPASPLPLPSPSHHQASSPIPSPTSATALGMPDLVPTTQGMGPMAVNNLSPTSARTQNWTAYQTNAVSPLAGKPAMYPGTGRKRSVDDDQGDHPAKRFVPSTRVPPSAATSQPQQHASRPLVGAPNLNMVTNHQASHQASHQQQQQSLPSLGPAGQATSYAQNSYMTPTSTTSMPDHISLPPLQPGVRAMSTLYGPAATGVPQQQSVQAVANAAGMPQTSFPGGPTVASQAPLGYGAGGKSHSPGSLAPYATSSPMADQFGGASGMHTPMAHTPLSNSPSFYLQQRNSPYRPIRHVNTLLYPPPSASLDQYHLAVPVQPTQMHYQPLGRRHDVRTGVVPEFVVYDRTQHPQLPRQTASQGHYHA